MHLMMMEGRTVHLQRSGMRIQDKGCSIWDTGHKIKNKGHRVHDTEHSIQNTDYKIRVVAKTQFLSVRIKDAVYGIQDTR